MKPVYLSHDDAAAVLSWPKAVEALRHGHLQPRAEMRDLIAGQATTSRTPSDITAFKNGGGAHLDLMIADAILKKMGL